MPELPEVETLKRKLRAVLPGKIIQKVTVLHPKSFRGSVEHFVQEKPHVVAIKRRAKLLEIQLSTQMSLLTHLKMTGQLIYLDDQQRMGGGHPTADWVQTLPSSHTRIQFDLAAGGKLYFNDQRLFGWVRLLDPAQVAAEYAKLGPDITDPTVTAAYLYPILQRRSIAIKQAMMDNRIVCGLGNIYICDALNLAQISPWRPAAGLTQAEVSRVLDACKTVITRGIQLGGSTTDGKYVDLHGFAGKYQTEMRTYDRAGEPCLNCGGPIQKEKQAGRGTYWCPGCQV